ncbi:MAG: alanine--tRNA ligase [Candidatus Methanofastidiosa archaeon]|nr:alanine--tRNA ligase [Candidatus Methanofastidiosa archaeon]
MDTKSLKESFREKASKDYRKYFPIDVLEENGFQRYRCKLCKKYFWSMEAREVCGDPDCTGGYSFMGDSPAKPMEYVECWEKFSKTFEGLGYTPIPRYPVVARWREDTEFVQASIYDFQPHVVSGAIAPPANPLVVPQFSLRFVDTDNVGISGRSHTGFVMIGQHAFTKKDQFDQLKYFRDIYYWLTDKMGIPSKELVFHEDGWAGGGNFGPCMEFFSRGVELGNQVYILYEMGKSGPRELDLKVLDMGAGQERFTWFSQGTPTIYDPVFPTVLDHLRSLMPVELDIETFKRFAPYSGMLNVDEVEDIDKTWAIVSGKLGMEPDSLKRAIMPMAACYSIADHSRSLLFALADGALPSNVGGGYNLRVLFRRAQYFLEKYGLDTEMGEICEMHADYIKKEFPFSDEAIEDVKKILSVEEEKYDNTKSKAKKIVRAQLSKNELSTEKLIELYDSHGVTPELVKEQADEMGVDVDIPKDFYIRVTQLHESNGTRHHSEQRQFGVKDTYPLYYDCEKEDSFEAEVVYSEGDEVILDRTAFYPEGGGQEHDIGHINGLEVTKVTKHGGVIVHNVKDNSLKVGQKVRGKISKSRRYALTRHHTATHIINSAARQVLGNHVWQAGAEKTTEKARLDITHFSSLSAEELERIELLANEMVLENIPVTKRFMGRDEAEKRYGFRIYQGGAVPGMSLRIVSIGEYDIEACGGTHCDSTSEVGPIKIIKSEKIQDGIVRLEYTAGLEAIKSIQRDSRILNESCSIFRVDKQQLAPTCERFFSEWKRRGKEIEDLKVELSGMKQSNIGDKFEERDGIRLLVANIDGDTDILRKTAFSLTEDDTVVVLSNGRQLVVTCGSLAQERGHLAKDVIQEYGKGGGKPDFAQGIVTGPLQETGA